MQEHSFPGRFIVLEGIDGAGTTTHSKRLYKALRQRELSVEHTCEPTSGGCGWCTPLDYFAKKLSEEFPETWDCGTNTTAEANNVVKTVGA